MDACACLWIICVLPAGVRGVSAGLRVGDEGDRICRTSIFGHRRVKQ